MEKGLQAISDKYNPIINTLHNLFTDYTISAEARGMALLTRDKLEEQRDFEAMKYKGEVL